MRYPFQIDGLEGERFEVEVPSLFGAPKLLVNGRPAPAGGQPREFLITGPDGSQVPVRLEFAKLGTELSVAIGDETVPLTPPFAWYEWAWNGLPLLLVAVGGLVGGLCGGLAAMVNVRVFRSGARPLARYALTAAVSLAALLAYVGVVVGIQRATGQAVADTPASPERGAAAKAAPAAKAAKTRALVLPGDWPVLQQLGGAEITGADAHERLTLRLGRVPENLSITVPAGLLLRPARPETPAGACLTSRPTVLTVTAGGAGNSFTLPVVNAESSRWELPRPTDTFAVAGVEASAELLKFLQQAQDQKLHHYLVQTGTWVLKENITAAQFSKNRLFTNIYDVDLGARRTTTLAGYAGIRELRLCIQKMGTDPMTFRLFQDFRAEFDKALRQASFEQPQTNWDTMLANGALETYAGEPETEALLLKYATRHASLAHREHAVRSLLKLGLSGEPPALLQQLLTTTSREHRLLAAHALIAAGDARGQPVLAAFAEDPSLGRLIAGPIQSLREKTKLAPLPGETALALWERAGGWETLQQQYGDVGALRALVSRREAVADPWLDEFVGKMKGASDQETATLLRTLESRYKNNPKAYAAVRSVLLTHPKWQVRQSAGRALVDGWQQAGDVRGTLSEVMEKEADHQVTADLLRHAVVFGKLSQPAPLIEAALRHRLAEVRVAALAMLQRDRKAIGEGVVAAVLTPEVMARLAENDPAPRVRFTVVGQLLTADSPLAREPAEAVLLRVAAREQDKSVRSAALNKLCDAKVRGVLPIMKRMLAGSKEDKTSAVSLLDRWKTDPETLALLESVRKDPDVGRHATNVLKRHGR